MPRSRQLLVLALGACGAEMPPTVDTDPPTVVSITPASGTPGVWLHQPIRIAFSEPLAPESVRGASVTDGAGQPIPATVDAPSATELVVEIADDAAVVGELRLALTAAITDVAGNALAPTGASWGLEPWVRSEMAGATPVIAVDDAGRIVSARTVDSTSGHRIVAGEWDGTAWVDLGGQLGADDAALPAIAFDAAGAPVVVWSEFPLLGTSRTPSVQGARWNGTTWQPLLSPGPGGFAVISRPPSGEPVIVYMTPSTFGGRLLRTRVLAGDDWQPLAQDFDIPATGQVLGIPQLVAVVAATPIIAFVDTGNDASGPQVRIMKWTGSVWSEVSPIALGPIPPNELVRVSIAARGNDVVVAHDVFAGSFGVHAVRITGNTWVPLGGELDIDPSSDARAPAIAIDADGTPIVAWHEMIDGNARGILARWTGTGWTIIGGSVWNDDPTRALVRPALALLHDRVPLVAWSELVGAAKTSATRVALFNGPKTPPIPGVRVSIAGCTFDTTRTTLSSTGCFMIANGRATPHAGLIPFDVTSELWSDGALKRRWMALPDGAAMTTPPIGAWSAPAGTMFLKEFAIETTPGDAATRRVMETRLLVVTGASNTPVQGFSFRWRPDGSDADLLPDAPSTFGWPLDNGTIHTHSYPSRAQCLRCHNSSNGPLLGLRTGQLSRRFDYGGNIANQLEVLEHVGAIPAQVGMPSLAFTSPHDTSLALESRVRGYLAANCSHCHNPTGERPTRDFRFETPLAQTMLCGPDQEVVAGSPATSVIFQRISSRPGGMPPLATLQIDPLALDIVSRWIATETNCQ